MASNITNRAKMTLIIPLNSGASLYLAPGETAEVEDYELSNNGKVEKLLRENMLSSDDDDAGSASRGVPAALAAGAETPPDTRTTSALNTGPAPDASSTGPGDDAPGTEGRGGRNRNR